MLLEKLFTLAVVISLISFFPGKTSAQDSVSIFKLKRLSVEELMDIEVTSISARPEKLTEVA